MKLKVESEEDRLKRLKEEAEKKQKEEEALKSQQSAVTDQNSSTPIQPAPAAATKKPEEVGHQLGSSSSSPLSGKILGSSSTTTSTTSSPGNALLKKLGMESNNNSSKTKRENENENEAEIFNKSKKQRLNPSEESALSQDSPFKLFFKTDLPQKPQPDISPLKNLPSNQNQQTSPKTSPRSSLNPEEQRQKNMFVFEKRKQLFIKGTLTNFMRITLSPNNMNPEQKYLDKLSQYGSFFFFFFFFFFKKKFFFNYFLVQNEVDFTESILESALFERLSLGFDFGGSANEIFKNPMEYLVGIYNKCEAEIEHIKTQLEQRSTSPQKSTQLILNEFDIEGYKSKVLNDLMKLCVAYFGIILQNVDFFPCASQYYTSSQKMLLETLLKSIYFFFFEFFFFINLEKRSFIGICSEPRLEWAITDFCCCFGSFVSIPLQRTLSEDDLDYIIQKTNIQILVISSLVFKKLINVVLKNSKKTLTIKYVILIDLLENDDEKTINIEEENEKLNNLIKIMSFSKIMKENNVNNNNKFIISKQDDIMTVVFTSGSTGRPKGCSFFEKEWTQQIKHLLTFKVNFSIN